MPLPSHPTAPGSLIRDRSERLLGACEPYVVSSPVGAAGPVARIVDELGIRSTCAFDPFRVASRRFLTLLQRLESHAATPYGTSMPRWALYDCGEVPGVVVGLAQPARDLPAEVRGALRIDDDDEGPVPITMAVLIPMLRTGCWHSFALCGAPHLERGDAPIEPLIITLGLGLCVVSANAFFATSMGRTTLLDVHARFAPLRLLTAWTPAHTHPDALTYRADLPDGPPDRILRGAMPSRSASEVTRWVDCEHAESLRELQREIERGRQFEVLGPPRLRDAVMRLPIREAET